MRKHQPGRRFLKTLKRAAPNTLNNMLKKGACHDSDEIHWKKLLNMSIASTRLWRELIFWSATKTLEKTVKYEHRLHQALARANIFLLPTSQPPSQGADFVTKFIGKNCCLRTLRSPGFSKNSFPEIF
jgi:hypothetical protein